MNSSVRLDGLKPMPLGSSRSAVMKQARQPAIVRLSQASTAGHQVCCEPACTRVDPTRVERLQASKCS